MQTDRDTDRRERQRQTDRQRQRQREREGERGRERVNKGHARSFTEELKRLLSLALIDVQYLGKVGGANISPCS